ncbi:MAG: hypothetical protein PHX61_12415 [Alphaproteobacteria bacterium]|nr:hypothetical protein [Alphaproteobacteria bacterium]
MNKKIIIGMLFILAVASFSVRGTYSVIQSSIETQKAINAPYIGIDFVNGDGSAVSDNYLESEAFGMPGDIIDDGVAIKNTENTVAYVRVTIYRYWADEDGTKNLTAKEEPGYLDPEEIGFTVADDWLVFAGDEYSEVVYAYYTKPLEPGTMALIIDSYTYLDVNENNNLYANKIAHLEFYGEGIQTIAAKEAFRAEWGVDVEFDTDMNIVSIGL